MKIFYLKELFPSNPFEEIPESQTCSRFEGSTDLLIRDGYDCRFSPSLFSFWEIRPQDTRVACAFDYGLRHNLRISSTNR